MYKIKPNVIKFILKRTRKPLQLYTNYGTREGYF